MSDQPDGAGGQGEGAPSREDLRQQARAIRQRWPIDASVRAGILRKAVALIDDETPEGALAGDRIKLAAMKVVMAADKLNLEERRLELVERRLGQDDAPAVDVDLVAEAERIAAERKARTAGEAGP